MSDRQRVQKKPSSKSGDSANPRLPSAWIIAIIYLGLALATLILYSPLRQAEFVNWDDGVFVYHNPHVADGLSLENFQWSLGIHGPGQWHPVSWWVHQLNCELFGLEPGAHHMASVSLHVIVTLLLLTVLWRISGSFWPSALVAGLHALHPLSVESIAWVAHLREPLSLLFWLLVMWSYCSYTRHGGVGRYLLVVLLFALGLMAKPTLITLPFVLLLLDWWPLNRVSLGANFEPQNRRVDPAYRSMGKLILEKIPLLALSFASVCLAYLCQKSMGSVVSLESHSMAARLANAAQSYVLYLRNMVWPLNLATLYPLPEQFHTFYVVGALLMLIGITVMALYFCRRAPHLLVGWLWYLGTLVPVIGIVKMGAMTAMTDHYMYVSLLGIYIAIAWQLAWWVGQKPKCRMVICGVAGVVLIACTTLTGRQVAVWRNSETLWKHTLAVGAPSTEAHNNLGDALLESGRYKEALKHFKEASRLAPNSFLPKNNAGTALLSLGRAAESIPFFQDAATKAPNRAEVQYNLGRAFQLQENWSGAIEQYEKAILIKPQFADAHTNVGVCLRTLGRTEEAIRHFEQAIQSDPNFVGAHIQLGITLNALGRKTEALPHFEKALGLEPNDFTANYHSAVVLLALGRRTESLKHFQASLKVRHNHGGAHHGISWIMATAPEIELRNGKRAIEHARRAFALNKGNPFMVDGLAAAHAEAGEFTAAVNWQRQAVKMVSGNTKIAFEKRLASYQQNLPYRQPK